MAERTRRAADGTIGECELRAYRPDDWPRLRAFMKATWRDDHPMTDRQLFDWQFRGFGHGDTPSRSIVLLSGDRLLGFRGVIPGLYQVPAADKDSMQVIEGGSLAMWMLRPECRGLGLGKRMHQHVQEALPVLSGAGSNPRTSVPIYRRNGFSIVPSMPRFVVPLRADGYVNLLADPVDVAAVAPWASRWRTSAEPLAPTTPDVAAIADLWYQATHPLRIFALHRNADFWNWRYVNSQGFGYQFFGDPAKAGIVVARVERVVDDKGADHGLRVLRIIEIVPRAPDAWQGQLDEAFSGLLRRVLSWAFEQQCVAADFNCSSTRYTPMLEAAGFRRQYFEKPVLTRSLAVTFAPLSFKTSPMNALYRIEREDGQLWQPEFDSTYLVKSHNDMDRPAVLRDARPSDAAEEIS